MGRRQRKQQDRKDWGARTFGQLEQIAFDKTAEDEVVGNGDLSSGLDADQAVAVHDGRTQIQGLPHLTAGKNHRVRDGGRLVHSETVVGDHHTRGPSTLRS